MAPATLREVAVRCGVSTATASRALNDRQDVSEETKQRIKQAALELGYVPNTMAKGLWSGSTKTIGVVITTVLSPFYASLVAALETVLRKEGYNIVLCSSLEDPDIELAAVKTLIQQRVDGIVLAPVQDDPAVEYFLEKNGIPYVLVARHARDLKADYVGSDDVTVGSMAVSYLIKKGHTRIGFINSVGSSSAIFRRKGYEQALQENGLAVRSDYTWSLGPNTPLEVSLRTILDLEERPTALFCFCDEIALPTMAFLKENGFSIPGDMAIISVDNLHYSSQLSPALTTVDTHKEMIGREAAQVLLEKLKGKRRSPREILIPAEIVSRASV